MDAIVAVMTKKFKKKEQHDTSACQLNYGKKTLQFSNIKLLFILFE